MYVTFDTYRNIYMPVMDQGLRLQTVTGSGELGEDVLDIDRFARVLRFGTGLTATQMTDEYGGCTDIIRIDVADSIKSGGGGGSTCSELCYAGCEDLTTSNNTIDTNDWRRRAIWASIGDPEFSNDVNESTLLRVSYVTSGHGDRQIAQDVANNRQLWVSDTNGSLYTKGTGNNNSFVWAKASAVLTGCY